MDGIELLRLQVACRLEGIHELCKEAGLDGLSRFTLIARDPDDDTLCILVTNEPNNEAVQEAVDVCLRNSV